MDMTIIDSDVLIIGSGVAGMMAALEVKRKGRRPLLVSKSRLGKANNTYLSGGMFAISTEGFDKRMHLEMTLQAGGRINELPLVKKMVEESPYLVNGLRGMGMKGAFQKTGFLAMCASPIGGPEIASTLMRACRHEGIKVLEGVMITDLIKEGDTCHGAIGFQKVTGEVYGLRSSAVVLTSGGAGAIYAKNDNAPGMTGDGYVLGLEAGLELMDMEFVQFYPLIYAGSGHPRKSLHPVFADLGNITNRLGEDLKAKYDLRERPVAVVCRDRLSRALFSEILEGNAIHGALLLDIRHLQDEKFPLGDRLKAFCKKVFSYDSKPIEITPACHYNMGGLIIDDSCRTNLKGLFAAGEVTGGTDGANRMGGNGLSGALVFGALAAQSAIERNKKERSRVAFKSMAQETANKKISKMSLGKAGPLPEGFLIKRLGKVLWEKAGIIRHEQALRECLTSIDGFLNELDMDLQRTPKGLSRFLECRNAALVGRAIVLAALERTESRGSHYRKDFPKENKEWIKHIKIGMQEGLPGVSGVIPVANE